jgi:hypothetical protein
MPVSLQNFLHGWQPGVRKRQQVRLNLVLSEEFLFSGAYFASQVRV